MAEVEYLHLCDYSFRAEGNKTCIIGIIDAIYSDKAPFKLDQMMLVVQFRRGQPGPLPIEIEFRGPNGEAIVSAKAQLSVDAAGNAFQRLTMFLTTFPEFGRYTIVVSSAGRQLATHSINVLEERQSPPSPGQSTIH